jgi:hypothetical protein
MFFFSFLMPAASHYVRLVTLARIVPLNSIIRASANKVKIPYFDAIASSECSELSVSEMVEALIYFIFQFFIH